MTTFEKVREIIAKSLNADAASITMETRLAEDLHCDSLDAVEIVMNLEDEFGLEVDDEKLQQIKSVGDLVTIIDEIK